VALAGGGFGLASGKARERRSGEIPIEAFAGIPWKGEAQGSNQRSVG
jgi:hypothetical protein